MKRPTVLREVVHLHLHSELYETEMEISGKQTYFHGSPELMNLGALKAENIGHYKCIFFTSHFGYALNRALPIGGTHGHYQAREKFYNEIVFDKPVRPIRNTGYIYPIMLQLKPKILELNDSSDAINLASVLWKAGLSKNIATDGDAMQLMNHMRKHGWLTLDYKEGGSEDMAFGLSRNMMIKLLHDDPNIIGFSYHERKNALDDYEYPAIGVFHDKIITDWITKHKPMRVRYDGERFNPRKNANEYVVSVKNI
jgi:hypothetical protein